MAEITQITDHADIAVSQMASEYRGKEALEGLLAALVEGLQPLEDTFYALIFDRFLSNGTGETLDFYGKLAGCDREGREDAVYRFRIRATILKNRSQGKSSTMIRITRAVAFGDEDTGTVKYSELYPAQVVLEFDGVLPDADSWEFLAEILQKAAPLGVLVGPVVETGMDFEGEAAFGFEEDTTAAGFGVGKFATDVVEGTDRFYFDVDAGTYYIPAAGAIL